MPTRKKVPVHKPYKLGWEEGEIYYFQIKEPLEGYEEYDKYVGNYILVYVDKIYTKAWVVKGIYDEVAEICFLIK